MPGVPEVRSRVRHLVPLIALQGFALVCGLIGVRWSSAIVPPEILGLFALLVGTHIFATMATHQGLVQHVQRHWTPQVADRIYGRLLLRSAARPTLILAGGLVLVWLAIRSTAGSISPGWWGWMLAVNVFAAAANILHAAFQAEERYWAHCVASMVSSATRSFLPLVFVAAGGASLALLGAGFLGHTVLWFAVTLFLLPAIFRSPAQEPTAALESPTRTVRTFLWVGILGWMGGIAHRFSAAGTLDPATTGYFMLAANLTAIIPTAIGLIGQSYTFPVIYAAARRGAGQAELWRMTRRNVLAVMAIAQVLLLALHLCGPSLIGTLLDVRYAPSIEWLLATGGAMLATVSGGFICILFIAQNRERACLGLIAISVAFRLAIVLSLAFLADATWFRLGLSVLPWPTLALEWWFVGNWCRRHPDPDPGPTTKNVASL